MRSTDEQFQEILKRSDKFRERHSSRKAIITWSVAAAACAVLLVFAASLIPALSAGSSEAGFTHYGSLILDTSYMGYVVIGVLAFLLGVCVTLLCLRIRKKQKKERDGS